MIDTHLLLEAYSHIDRPYIWGGNRPIDGFDCSGLVNFCLKQIGFLSSKDRSSQMLYKTLVPLAMSSEIKPDSILFFGKDVDSITHIAIAINQKLMIGASGGDSTTITIYNAVDRKDARVRIDKIESRKDLIASIYVNFYEG